MPSVPIFCRFEVGGLQVQNCFKLGKELAQKAHVQVKFCFDPVRSDYFPEWKLAFKMDFSNSLIMDKLHNKLKFDPGKKNKIYHNSLIERLKLVKQQSLLRSVEIYGKYSPVKIARIVYVCITRRGYHFRGKNGNFFRG